MRPVQGRNSNVGNSGMGGGNDDGDEEDTTLDFNDPTTLNGINGMSHDRQHVYINPQDLRENPPPPPPPQQQPTPVQQQQQANQGMRQVPPQAQQQQMPPPPQPQPQHQPQPHTQPSAMPMVTDAPALNLALSQDLLSRCLHYLNLQTKVAQEKLDYLRRREARELNELNARKELEKTASAKNKTEKAFVSRLVFHAFTTVIKIWFLGTDSEPECRCCA